MHISRYVMPTRIPNLLVNGITFGRIFRFHTVKCPVTVDNGHNCTILTVFTLVMKSGIGRKTCSVPKKAWMNSS